MVGPIITGPMAQAVGWRSFWWLNVAILAFNTITLTFTFPETKWHRTHPSEITNASPATAGVTSDTSSADRGDFPTKGVDTVETRRKGPMSDLAHSGTAQQDPYLGRGNLSKA
jgi:MFS family permease